MDPSWFVGAACLRVGFAAICGDVEWIFVEKNFASGEGGLEGVVVDLEEERERRES